MNMSIVKKMNRAITFLLKQVLPVLILFSCNYFKAIAQKGEVSILFTASSGKSISIKMDKPMFKFDNPHGYWFINPHNAKRHFNVQPDAGYGYADAAFIDLNDMNDDMDIYKNGDNNINSISFRNKGFTISAPKYYTRDGDNNPKPLHIHITKFTAAEIAFTISGTAYYQSLADNSTDMGLGNIEGSGYFFREPTYDKSDVLIGCNCDPTIYATVYDAESDMRSNSACEKAWTNKLYNAVKKAYQPLYDKLQYNTADNMKAGDIYIRPMPGCVDMADTSIHAVDCPTDYTNGGLTRLDAHKRLVQKEDAFDLRLMQQPGDSVMAAPAVDVDYYKRLASFADSLTKMLMAKKISQEEYMKRLKAASENKAMTNMAADLKKKEMELNLTIKILVNPDNAEQTLLKLSDVKNTKIQHNIKGASFEIYSPQLQDNDGSWLGNRLNIYVGKFTPPVSGVSGGGFPAKVTKAIYPPKGNKLNIYSIIIKLDGGKDLLDKAVANIDFSELASLITR